MDVESPEKCESNLYLMQNLAFTGRSIYRLFQIRSAYYFLNFTKILHFNIVTCYDNGELLQKLVSNEFITIAHCQSNCLIEEIMCRSYCK